MKQNIYPTEIWGHRGFPTRYPENTIVSFQGALAVGVDGLEFDVQRTKDGQIVVIHDLDVERTTNGQGLVADHTLAEIRRLDAGKWYGKRFTGVQVPTLHEVLTMIRRWPTPVRINIEFKVAESAKPDLRLVQQTYNIAEYFSLNYCIVYSSFEHNGLFALKAAHPTAHIGLLYEIPMPQPWKYAQSKHASSIHPDFRLLTQHTVSSAHDAHIRVYAYTVNNTEDAVRLSSWGVDAVMTDCPDVLLKQRNPISD